MTEADLLEHEDAIVAAMPASRYHDGEKLALGLGRNIDAPPPEPAA